ncbi:MAG: 4Fe-4S dicluster domain-containing protein [Pseudomonadota bacterium]
MAISVDPSLSVELKKYGVTDAATCFNCGNCTAVCALSTENTPFPRKVIRYLQIGAADKLLHSPEPWLCYYCGECTDTCPRDANPGEMMMGMRRYLTARYDRFGISKLFYTSKAFEIFAILFLATLVGLGFYFFHGPIVTDRVALNQFASSHVIEILDLGMLAILSFFLLTNARFMAKAILGDPGQYQSETGKVGAKWHGISLSLYLSELKVLLTHFLTQKKFKGCGSKEQRVQWIAHLLIMSGYSTIFILVVVFLRWFQRDEILPLWNPVRLLGYYGTFAILYGTTYAIWGRLKKVKTVYKFSHSSDWAFLILLWLTTFSGILIHFTRLLEMPLPTYALYVIHMMIAIPMLVLEVPFAKWAHLLYRPLALYLMRVKEKAMA